MKERKAIRKGLVFGIVLALVAVVFASVPMNVSAEPAIIYVDDVAGSGPGNPPEDYTSIQEAVDAASSGDTIYVYSGTYNEQVTIDISLTLEGEDSETTIVQGVGSGTGIYLNSISDVTIKNLQVKGFSSGIYLYYSSSNTISGNTVSGNDYGIYLWYSNSNTISGNTVSSNRLYGIHLWESDSNTISGNTVSGHSNGIRLYYYSSSNTISGNTVLDNYYGFWLWLSAANIISGNTVSGNYYGIHLTNADSNTISGNTISGNSYTGIRVKNYCSSNTISGNTVSGSGSHGIGQSWSDSSTISGNTVSGSGSYGLYLSYSSSSTLRNNDMVSNSYNFGVLGSSLSHFIQDIDTSNTVDEKPIYYWVGRSYETVPSDAGYVGIVNSDHITVQGLTLTHNIQGINFAYTSDSTIQNVDVSGNDYGIYLRSSNSNTISGNTVSGSGSCGIYMLYSSSNTISGNTVSGSGSYGIYLGGSSSNTLRNNVMVSNTYNFGVLGNSLSHFIQDIDTSNTIDEKPIYYWVGRSHETVPSDAGYVGIVDSDHITVQGLTITNNYQGILFAYTSDSTIQNVDVSGDFFGIYLYYSSSNTISGNTISGNNYGIYLLYSSSNEIYHNNIIDNTDQIYRYSSSNTWNNGAGEGNYWSDYSGLDDGSNERTSGDGIGDTNLPHQGVDNYPLMEPWRLDDEIEDLIEDIEEMNLPDGIENSLVSKLENAISSIEKENYNAAVNQLNAFINEVKAQRGKALTEAQADMLIAAAEEIIDNIWEN